LFSSTFASDALSVFSTFPRSGRIACRARSRPLLRGSAGGVAFDGEDLTVLAAGRRAVAQLAGEGEAVRRGGLSRDLLLRRPARLARTRRQDDPRDDRLGNRDIRIEPVLERGPHLRINRGSGLWIVQPILRLSLKLRLLDEDAEDGHEPFANVLRRERHPFRRQIVRVDEVADGFPEARAEPVLVRAAGAGRNAVDVRAHVLVGRLRPSQREVQADAALVAFARQRERDFVDGDRLALGEDFLQVIDEAFLVLIDDLLARRLVLERDADALV
jgi:hypothetical protein